MGVSPGMSDGLGHWDVQAHRILQTHQEAGTAALSAHVRTD